MKSLINLLAVSTTLWVLNSSCNSPTQKPADEAQNTKPNSQEIMRVQESILNTYGELDAVAAKYNIGRDTIQAIIAEHVGQGDSSRVILGLLNFSGKQRRPANAVAKELAMRYHLPYSTVGGIIYDTHALLIKGAAAE
ncbi:hypothetical protein [Hymenobacter radiodurans]|uniref:hypothetical protein n=1 Tax=Hymenobacter radiodurans TaxID=2496028 RepID=UPI001058B6EF|nr:hypothetical protein [Hymenobacter radiodurans]